MADGRLTRCRGVLAGLSLAACSAPSVPTTEAAASPRARTPPSFEGGLGNVEVRSQGLVLPLPDARGWQRVSAETHSWVAEHAATQSRLLVRAWHHEGIARVADCERQARAWRVDLPQIDAADLIEARPQTLAGVYAGQVSVGVHTDARDPSHPIQGQVLALGSDGRDCLCLAFSTSAAGPGALRVVAERLGVMSQTVFARARRTQLDARVIAPRR